MILASSETGYRIFVA